MLHLVNLSRCLVYGSPYYSSMFLCFACMHVRSGYYYYYYYYYVIIGVLWPLWLKINSPFKKLAVD